tara:strand:+ start:279 stop:533 length:255 start_codon:yes stop_codon:yes gene_type:complete
MTKKCTIRDIIEEAQDEIRPYLDDVTSDYIPEHILDIEVEIPPEPEYEEKPLTDEEREEIKKQEDEFIKSYLNIDKTIKEFSNV